MKFYYVNTCLKSNEVHLGYTQGYINIPNFMSRKFFEFFSNFSIVIKASKKFYTNSVECKICSINQNTKTE